jgi:hypothetical protein
MLQYDESSLWPFCYSFNPVLISRKLDVGSQEVGGRE